MTRRLPALGFIDLVTMMYPESFPGGTIIGN